MMQRIKQSRLFLLTTLPLTLSAGCSALDNGSDGSGTPSSETGADGSGTTTGGSAMTIYEIQQGVADGSVSDGEAVTVNEVVVTSPVVDKDGQQTVYVQESPGGEWSGIAVFSAGGFGQELNVGDVVSFSGSVSEFFDHTQISLASGEDLSVSSSGTPLEPMTVSAADIATGSATAENWESVLVRVENVACTVAVNMYGEFQVDDSLVVDDYFLVAANQPSIEPNVGDEFMRIDGLLTYNFEEFKLAPRDADDVDAGASGDTTGGDGDSTGGDGDVSIYDVQMGTVGVGSTVTLTDVVVTSPTDPDNEVFYVQEEAGGEYSGISVYLMDATGLDVAPGDLVTLTGTYEEFFENSQIVVASTADLSVTGAASVPTPSVVAPGDVATNGSAQENWEGVLVRVENVSVTDDALGFGDFQVTDGLRVDDFFFPMDTFVVPANGTAFSSITGIMTYAFDDARLSIRDDNDLVAQ
jgi:predicted extracellular nuclease